MIPARRSTANSCSRNCTGTSRRRASSPIDTGSEPPLRASSASASTAYGDLLVIEIIAGRRARRPGCDRSALEPAALGGDEHGLGAIDSAELAVDVVQVSAHGAGREGQLVRDLLVDLSLGEPLQNPQLASGQRTRIDVARALARRARELVHHPAQLLRAESDGARAAQQLARRDRG